MQLERIQLPEEVGPNLNFLTDRVTAAHALADVGDLRKRRPRDPDLALAELVQDGVPDLLEAVAPIRLLQIRQDHLLRPSPVPALVATAMRIEAPHADEAAGDPALVGFGIDHLAPDQKRLLEHTVHHLAGAGAEVAEHELRPLRVAQLETALLSIVLLLIGVAPRRQRAQILLLPLAPLGMPNGGADASGAAQGHVRQAAEVVVTGAIVPALLIRILTECLRMPTFIHEQKRDQVQLCCVVLLMCVIGLIRYAFF